MLVGKGGSRDPLGEGGAGLRDVRSKPNMLEHLHQLHLLATLGDISHISARLPPVADGSARADELLPRRLVFAGTRRTAPAAPGGAAPCESGRTPRITGEPDIVHKYHLTPPV